MAHEYEQLNFFPDEVIDLNKELQYPEHEPLKEILANHSPHDFYIRLAQIAAYCEVILEGDYGEDELKKLCVILTARLKEKRTKIHIPAFGFQ